jgi:hypothetical protein
MRQLLILALFVASCAAPDGRVAESARGTSRTITSVPLQPSIPYLSEDGYSLHFGPVKVTFPSAGYLDTSSLQIAGDSVRVWLDIGTSIEDSLFFVDLPPGHTIKIFDRYRTSVVIDDEGPHYDLTDWKHFDSDWHAVDLLKRYTNGVLVFRHPKYSDADWQRQPSYTKRELFDFLRSRKMEDLAARLASPKKNDYIRANSSISSIFLKLLVTRPDSLQYIRYVEFEIPMGC